MKIDDLTKDICLLITDDERDKSDSEILGDLVYFVEDNQPSSDERVGLKAAALIYSECYDKFKWSEDFNMRLFYMLKLQEAKAGILCNCLSIMVMNKDKFEGCDYLMWVLFCVTYSYLKLGNTCHPGHKLSMSNDGLKVRSENAEDRGDWVSAGYDFLWNYIKTIYQKSAEDVLSSAYFDWDRGCFLDFNGMITKKLTFKDYLMGIKNEE